VDTIEITSEETTSEQPGAEAPVTETAPSEKPAGLPEKFESVDELVKSYQELEKKLGIWMPLFKSIKQTGSCQILRMKNLRKLVLQKNTLILTLQDKKLYNNVNQVKLKIQLVGTKRILN
jgi:hypothetical protein